MANVKLVPTLHRFDIGTKAVETCAAQVAGRSDYFVGGFAAVPGCVEGQSAGDRGTFFVLRHVTLFATPNGDHAVGVLFEATEFVLVFQ